MDRAKGIFARDVRTGSSRGAWEGPQRRLWKVGAAALSDPELLTVLFGEPKENPVLGLAENLIALGGGLKALCQKDPQELANTEGMTPRRAAQMAAALELGRRVMKSGDDRPVLSTPEEVFAHVAPDLCPLRTEVFHVLCFNSRNKLLANVRVSEGGTAQCPVDPKNVFSAALRASANCIVLAHNHPSGDPQPSAADYALTRQLLFGGRLLCIQVLDHLIVGDWKFQSMSQRGELRRIDAEWSDRWLSRGGS